MKKYKNFYFSKFIKNIDTVLDTQNLAQHIFVQTNYKIDWTELLTYPYFESNVICFFDGTKELMPILKNLPFKLSKLEKKKNYVKKLYRNSAKMRISLNDDTLLKLAYVYKLIIESNEQLERIEFDVDKGEYIRNYYVIDPTIKKIVTKNRSMYFALEEFFEDLNGEFSENHFLNIQAKKIKEMLVFRYDKNIRHYLEYKQLLPNIVKNSLQIERQLCCKTCFELKIPFDYWGKKTVHTTNTVFDIFFELGLEGSKNYFTPIDKISIRVDRINSMSGNFTLNINPKKSFKIPSYFIRTSLKRKIRQGFKYIKNEIEQLDKSIDEFDEILTMCELVFGDI